MSYLGQQLGQGQAERFVYTATGGETSVSVDDASRPISYTVGQVDVFLNGSKLVNGSDFTATNGSTITGLAALSAADVVEVFALSIFQASDTVSASSGGTFSGPVVLDSVTIHGGTIDGTTIGDSSAAAGTFTTLNATGGGALTGTWTDLGSVTTVDMNGGTIDGVVIGDSATAAGSFTTLQADTSLNVDGTATVDGLTVDGDGTLQTSDGAILTLKSTDTTLGSTEVVGSIQFNTADASNAGVASKIEANAENASGEVGLNFHTGKSSALIKRLNINRDGDISFYEDTGTTPKFFWDASAERLGIGTASPSYLLDIGNTSTSNTEQRIISTSAGGTARLRFDNNTSVTGNLLTTSSATVLGTGGMVIETTSSHPIVFRTNSSGAESGGNERMRIDSSGNVVIGSGGLDVSGIGGTYTALNMRAGSGYPVLYGQTTATTTNSAAMQVVGATSGASAGGAAEMLGVIQIAAESDSSTNATGYMNFYTGSGGSVTEAMRITSSGNLLVGTTSSSIYNDTSGNGIQLNGGSGQIVVAKQSASATDPALWLNNTGDDGDIATFAKDGTKVGSVGNDSTALTIGSGSTGVKFGTSAVWATTGGSTNANGTKDLGASTVRWKDLYLSGGVYLGGTGAANLLDDYEEGTWTPVVEGSSTAGTYTLNNVLAYYTKIGNQVTCYTSFGFSAASGGSGDFRLKGLPFNYKANSVINTSPRISEINTGQPSAINLVMNQVTTSSDDTLSLVAILDNSARAFVSITGVSTSSSMVTSFTYTVS